MEEVARGVAVFPQGAEEGPEPGEGRPAADPVSAEGQEALLEVVGPAMEGIGGQVSAEVDAAGPEPRDLLVGPEGHLGVELEVTPGEVVRVGVLLGHPPGAEGRLQLAAQGGKALRGKPLQQSKGIFRHPLDGPLEVGGGHRLEGHPGSGGEDEDGLDLEEAADLDEMGLSVGIEGGHGEVQLEGARETSVSGERGERRKKGGGCHVPERRSYREGLTLRKPDAHRFPQALQDR